MGQQCHDAQQSDRSDSSMDDGEEDGQAVGKSGQGEATSLTPGTHPQPSNNHIDRITSTNFVATNNKFGLINSNQFGTTDLTGFQ